MSNFMKDSDAGTDHPPLTEFLRRVWPAAAMLVIAAILASIYYARGSQTVADGWFWFMAAAMLAMVAAMHLLMRATRPRPIFSLVSLFVSLSALWVISAALIQGGLFKFVTDSGVSPPGTDTALYILEIIANGVLLDLFESYGIKLTAVTHDTTDLFTSTFVFATRSLGQIVVTFALFQMISPFLKPERGSEPE